MKPSHFLFGLALCLALGACQARQSEQQMPADALHREAPAAEMQQQDQAGFEELDAEPAPAPAPTNSPVPVQLVGQNDSAASKIPTQMIRTAELRFLVEDYEAARERVKKLTESRKGYLSSVQETNDGYTQSTTAHIRVPSRQFDALLADLLALASYVEANQVEAQDVTAEFIDIASRLKTKREVEKRYLELLKQARNVGEVLEVEEKLRLIREEVEAQEGRLKYLRDQVQYSTIRLTFYYRNPHYREAPAPDFFSRVAQALTDGWGGLLSLLVGMVQVWPLWPLLAAAWWLWRRFGRKGKPQA